VPIASVPARAHRNAATAAAAAEQPVLRIGVHPARERAARKRLLGALERAHAVRFEGREAGDWTDLDGLLSFGAEPHELPATLPSLCALGEERRIGSAAKLVLRAGPELERPLRGAALTDDWSDALAGEPLGSEDLVLAKREGRPLWAARAGSMARTIVAGAPAELAPGEALRERLAPGRCLALLALVHFLRSLAPDGRRPPATLRAAFVIDDPNLHWTSYGHIGYVALQRHAQAHGYHVSVAMVPLDGWRAEPRTARLFASHPGQLSICVHGNDHRGPELGMVRSPADGAALAAQALARAREFERRTGVAVDKVMVPPHEALSEPAARGLLASGFEGVCASRPYPWIDEGQARSPLAAPPERGALAAWSSREIVAGGLPMLLRAGFNAPREDLVLRAFLGQPLILYGHHDLLADGPDVLSDAAATIDALGDVRWGSLADVARAGVEARLAAGTTLEVNLLARRARFRVPAAARKLHLDAAALQPAAGAQLRVSRDGRALVVSLAADSSVLELAGGETVETTLLPEAELVQRRVAKGQLGPLLRRALSEARDRTSAFAAPRRGRAGLS
jgi:hypothetical protein